MDSEGVLPHGLDEFVVFGTFFEDSWSAIRSAFVRGCNDQPRHCSESHRLERTCSIDSEGIIHNLEVLLAEVLGVLFRVFCSTACGFGPWRGRFAGFGFSAWLRIRRIWPVG